MKVVLALDTSSGSAVLDAAICRPWPAKSYFEVLSVARPSLLWTTAEAALEAQRQAQHVVADAIAWIQVAGHDVAGAVFTGDPKAVILDRIQALRADWVMLGSSAGTQLPFGSVGAAVLRHAACSVEVVRADKNQKPDGLKILLATDGSEFSEQAAKSIAARPWPAATGVRMVSVAELILPSGRGFEALPLDSGVLEFARSEALLRAQAAIARARQILAAASGLALSESISVQDDKPKAILEEAGAWGADLLVLGARGLGKLRLPAGSVAEAVAMYAARSVQVIR